MARVSRTRSVNTISLTEETRRARKTGGPLGTIGVVRIASIIAIFTVLWAAWVVYEHLVSKYRFIFIKDGPDNQPGSSERVRVVAHTTH
jgi:hypothetical protein